MNVLNRGFITITPKKPFFDWSNTIDAEMQFTIEDDIEPTVYLITEDFFDVEPLIEQHFKKIFKNELTAITEEEELWPTERNIDVFLEWFDIQLGSMVFDLEKSNIIGEKI
jgi:hypothetical protein